MKPVVLLLEDNGDIRELLEEALRLEGYAIAGATSVGDALALLANGLRPSAALVDLLLPDRSGLEFVATVRALPERERFPMLLMTAVPQVAPAGAEVIVKPFDTGALLTRIGQLVPPGSSSL